MLQCPQLIEELPMKALTVGERVRVTSSIPSFWHHVGKIIRIVEPFVANEKKEQVLQEMPLYSVRLEDGRSFRFRGRDLEPVN
jgi:hypothetical protein